MLSVLLVCLNNELNVPVKYRSLITLMNLKDVFVNMINLTNHILSILLMKRELVMNINISWSCLIGLTAKYRFICLAAEHLWILDVLVPCH
jgi:hypothetical protein